MGRFQALFIEVSDDFGVGHFLDRLFGAMSVENVERITDDGEAGAGRVMVMVPAVRCSLQLRNRACDAG